MVSSLVKRWLFRFAATPLALGGAEIWDEDQERVEAVEQQKVVHIKRESSTQHKIKSAHRHCFSLEGQKQDSASVVPRNDVVGTPVLR